MLRRSLARKRSTGLILDISDTLLTTIRDASLISTVPFLQQAAGIALGILQLVQGTKDNRERFQHLADDVCTLVYTIVRTSRDRSDLSSKDLDSLEELLATLVSIDRFARKSTSRTLLLRMVRHKSDTGKIQRYREILKHSLDLFNLKASMRMQESLNRINERQVNFLSALQESRS